MPSSNVAAERWPALPLASWKDTCATLQLWTQIVGKVQVAATPWLNHSWHVTLHLTARGLGTPLIPAGDRDFQIEFDFVDHALWLRTTDGAQRRIAFGPMTVADFHVAVMAELHSLGIDIAIDGMPNEIVDPIPFAQDRTHRAYDREAVQRFWQILLRSHEVFSLFRSGFLGKASPVHFFWGSFDLAVTRFSGRPAPRHPGGIPHLPDTVTREAYSHEVSSAGFWPGGGAIDYPAYYSYAYPVPENFALQPLQPATAFFSKDLGEFILPYEAVRTAADPVATLMSFLDSTYAAAANTGKWDRVALECPRGEVRRPRTV